MKRYETIFIVDPDLSDEERSPLFERLTPLFSQMEGFLLTVDEWGIRKLAYEIKKKARGYYVRLDYCGTGNLVNEIERFFRIDDRILKYMTILVDPEANLDRLKAELAEAEAEKERAKQVAESDTEPKTNQDPESNESPEDMTQAENNAEEL